MIPVQAIGLALAGRAALSKTGLLSKFKSAKTLRTQRVLRIKGNTKISNRPSPLSNFIKSISSIVQKLTVKAPKEDLNEVIQRFLPSGASLLTPQYPKGIKAYQALDLDADQQNELVAAYTLDNKVNLLILKKQNNEWTNFSSRMASDYTSINYLSFADVTGSGKKDILVGWNTEEQFNKLEIYSIENQQLNKISTRNYSRLEVTDFSGKSQSPANTEIALWTEVNTGSYWIDVLKWDGSDLVPVENATPYYLRGVVPFYYQKVQQAPASSSNWYSLSDALIKAGLNRDALIAIEMGLRQKPVSPSENDFLALKETAMKALRK